MTTGDAPGLGRRTGARRFGLRARSALASVLVVLVALLIGGGGLVFVLQQNLERNATTLASARALEVADLISTIGLTEAISTVRQQERSGQLVQVIGPDRSVVGASDRQVDTNPLSDDFPPAGRSEVAEIEPGVLPGSEEWMVVARGVEARNAPYVVLVAVSVGAEHQAVRAVAIYLLIVSPVLLGGVALAVWFLIGRALGAVDRIRREVAQIDSSRLDQRVPVPTPRDEIAALAETMNAMLDRLERSDQAQRSFVSDASHELRSPLATLTAAAELAQDADETRRRRLLDTIQIELNRIRGLVDDLMTLARVDAQLEHARRDVDLDDLLDRQIRRLQATSSHRIEVALEPVRVVGDPGGLEHALRNLVDNAERYAHSAVRLTVQRDWAAAVVHVDNDGPVIAPGDRARVFERFVRLDSSRSRDAGGSGLGLAIARQMVMAHRGTLQVVDAPDGWCRFEIRLPTDPPPQLGEGPLR